jgi:hypothetical protein
MTSYMRGRARMSVAAILCVALVAALRRRQRAGGGNGKPSPASAAPDGGGAPPPPPYAGTRAGHGAARESRTAANKLGRGRCPAGIVPTAVNGELWGDVTNGLGLEAVTPHIRFEWTNRRGDDG